MDEKRITVAPHEHDRAFLEKLLLASRVILEAAPIMDSISDPLEVELDIFKDRLELMLLLPGSAAPGNGDPAV